MLKIKALSFENIHPFVRHVHLSGIESFIQSTLLKAYDYRLIYICGGKGYISINGLKYNASKGSLFLWKPGTEYLIYSDPTENLLIVGINFDFTHNNCELSNPIPPEKSKDFAEDNIVECIDFTDMEAFNKPIYFKDLRIFERELIEINDEYVTRKNFYSHRINGLFLSLIGNIARYTYTPNARLDECVNTIDLILKYIHDHYDQPISNREIGMKFNFHANYINKLMVLHTGTSLHQYLVNFRISRAINLMQTTSKSISEIAFLVGFKNENYFSKAFKRKTGVCPRNFRSYALGTI